MTFSPLAIRVLGDILESRTGQHLTENRLWRVDTVLAPLMREKGFVSIDQLAGTIVSDRNSKLADEVAEALLNHETFFFRDPPVFGHLLSLIDTRLHDLRASSRRLRIWCAGCSTGQEAYSLAMHFAEKQDLWVGWSIEIVGTDVSKTAIETARNATYSQFEIQRGLPIRQMLRWFESEGEDWRAVEDLRRRVSFQVHNLLDQPPSATTFDVVLCRNVLLYFENDVRTEVFSNLAKVVAPDGVLMLGAGETVLGQTDAFESDPDARGLYRKAAPRRVRAAG